MSLEIKTLEEILTIYEPKSVYILVEQVTSEVINEIDPEVAIRIIGAVERVRAINPKYGVIVQSISVFKINRPDVEKDMFGIVGNRVPWVDILKSDLVYVYQLDDKINLVRCGDLKPHSLFD